MGGIAVPPPQVAFAADEPLAGGELGLQEAPEFARHEARMEETAGERPRRIDDVGKRRRSMRKRVVVVERRQPAPMHGRRLVDRHFELVAERRAERILVAGPDSEGVDQRRPFVRRADAEIGGEGADLGLEPFGGPPPVFMGGVHLALERAGAVRRGLGLARRRLQAFRMRNGGLDRRAQRLAAVHAAGLRGKQRSALGHFGKLALRLLQAGVLFGDAAFQAVAPGHEIGKPRRRLVGGFLDLGEGGRGGFERLRRVGARIALVGLELAMRGLFALDVAQHRGGVVERVALTG